MRTKLNILNWVFLLSSPPRLIMRMPVPCCYHFHGKTAQSIPRLSNSNNNAPCLTLTHRLYISGAPRVRKAVTASCTVGDKTLIAWAKVMFSHSHLGEKGQFKKNLKNNRD